MLNPHPPAIVIGAGGHARVLIEALRLARQDILFVTDDNPRAHGRELYGYAVKGSQDEVLAYTPEQAVLVNAVGSTSQPVARSQVYQRFTTRGYRFIGVVHPSAIVSPNARLAPSVQVMAGAVIQEGAAIGANAIINTRATVDHGCSIGPHCHIAPDATLCGSVSVGQLCHVGAGATVIQGKRIGYRSLVAAGAVAVEDMPSESSVRGVPAKP